MAEISRQTASAPNSNPLLPSFSFCIWPPTQRTRDAVTNRLILTLTTHSLLSKRYGTLPEDEASDLANKIEEEAFSSASSSSQGATKDDDGIQILQFYSKEISKGMLTAVKSRSTPNHVAKELVSADDVVVDKEGVNADKVVKAHVVAEDNNEVGADDVAEDKVVGGADVAEE